MFMKVDAALRTRVLDGIPDKLTRFYVFPDVARRMNDALAEHRKKGDYDAITDADTLARTLTEHLRAVSHDLHLSVRYVPRVLPPEDPDPTADEPPTADQRAQLERVNCGFERVERLPSNVGYLKFNFFGDPDVCGPVATAAMAFLAHVDATSRTSSARPSSARPPAAARTLRPFIDSTITSRSPYRPAAQALEVAEKMAAEKVAARTTPPKGASPRGRRRPRK
jgi:N-terminal domain of Peptidase_S41 in eukaryotic IRBP